MMTNETPVVLAVFLETDGTLSYKPHVKGARWRSGFDGIAKLTKDADRALGTEHYQIDYVTERT